MAFSELESATLVRIRPVLDVTADSEPAEQDGGTNFPIAVGIGLGVFGLPVFISLIIVKLKRLKPPNVRPPTGEDNSSSPALRREETIVDFFASKLVTICDLADDLEELRHID
jgi:hypothetical protein